MLTHRHGKRFFSTAEVAQIVGVSRQAIFKKIKAGKIKASRVGRSFIINRSELPKILDRAVSDKSKEEIRVIVRQLIDEYGETLRLLGME